MSAIPAIPPTTASYDPTIDSDPIVCGDLGEEVAALDIELGNSERTEAHDQRSVDEVAQENDDNQQVQEIHDEASSLRTQAWVDGAIGVGEAGASVAIGLSYGSQASPAAAGVQGGSTALFTGANKVVDGLFGASQKDDEANAAADKASADRFQADAQDASQDATDAGGFVNAALDFARTYEATVASTQAAALHRA
jgi:hypothetical protein